MAHAFKWSRVHEGHITLCHETSFHWSNVDILQVNITRPLVFWATPTILQQKT